MHRTALDRQWDDLIALCRHEAELKRSTTHTKLLAFLSREIERAARDLGFGEEQIRLREFRAEKERGHVVRLFTK